MKSQFKMVTMAILFSLICIGKSALAAPVVDAHLVHYTIEPQSGSTFNRVEKLSIVVFADKLAKAYKTPYTLRYTVSDKDGKVVEGEQNNILFTMCDNKMVPVKAVGSCEEHNNVATISLKTRQTRRPPSTKGYRQEGKFWVNEEAAGKFPRFEEMEYKLDSYQLIDATGKVVEM